MMNIKNFKEYLPQQLLSMSKQYLLGDHAISISENGEGCYDAVIHDKGIEHGVEVTLGIDNIVEDCYCDKCKSLFCIHTVAILQIISQNIKMDAEKILSSVKNSTQNNYSCVLV